MFFNNFLRLMMTYKNIKIIEDPELLINARNSQGELGDKLIDKMNINHQGLAKWSLGHLTIDKYDKILDIGCGGGVMVDRFLQITESKVYEIIQGSVSVLPFDGNTFDIVTAFETVYFWPDFINDLKEVLRVLNDGGIFFIANEALPKENDERQKELIELLDMNIYSQNQLEKSLKKAGFSKINSFLKESKDSFTGEDTNWICVIAQ